MNWKNDGNVVWGSIETCSEGTKAGSGADIGMASIGSDSVMISIESDIVVGSIATTARDGKSADRLRISIRRGHDKSKSPPTWRIFP